MDPRFWPRWRSSNPGATCPEAIFLMAGLPHHSTPLSGASLPVETAQMAVRRRVSARLQGHPRGSGPGPDVRLQPTACWISTLAANGETPHRKAPLQGRRGPGLSDGPPSPRSSLMRTCWKPTRGRPRPSPSTSPAIPCGLPRRAANQRLAGPWPAADEGFPAQPGPIPHNAAGATPIRLCAEIRLGEVAVEFIPDELGFAIEIGEVTLTECQMISTGAGWGRKSPRSSPAATELTFGHCERKGHVHGDRRPEPLRDGAANEASAPVPGRRVRPLPTPTNVEGVRVRAASEVAATT